MNYFSWSVWVAKIFDLNLLDKWRLLPLPSNLYLRILFAMLKQRPSMSQLLKWILVLKFRKSNSMPWLTEKNKLLGFQKKLLVIKFPGHCQMINPAHKHSTSRSSTRTVLQNTKRFDFDEFITIFLEILQLVREGNDASSVQPVFTFSHYHPGVSKKFPISSETVALVISLVALYFASGFKTELKSSQ